MSDPIMGRYATVKIGTNLIQNLGRWTLNIRMDEIDVSVFGTVWGKTIPGMQKWTATAEGFYDPADATGQQDSFTDALAANKITDIRFYLDSTSYWAPDQSDSTYNGGYITNVDINHDKAGVAALTMNISGFGKIKLN